MSLKELKKEYTIRLDKLLELILLAVIAGAGLMVVSSITVYVLAVATLVWYAMQLYYVIKAREVKEIKKPN